MSFNYKGTLTIDTSGDIKFEALDITCKGTGVCQGSAPTEDVMVPATLNLAKDEEGTYQVDGLINRSGGVSLSLQQSGSGGQSGSFSGSIFQGEEISIGGEITVEKK